jgi:hypothetical protein
MDQAKVLGLVGLADIYLTQAGWASELAFYRGTKRWLDPDTELSPGPFRGLVPLGSTTAYRKARRCLLRAARIAKAPAADLTNLARGLTEAGLEPPPLQMGVHDADSDSVATRFAAFRASVVSTGLKASPAGVGSDLVTVQSRFRDLADHEVPEIWNKRKKQWRSLRRRFLHDRFIKAEVASLEDVCRKMGVPFRQTCASETFEYRYRCVFNGHGRDRHIVVDLPSAGLARLPNVTDLGFGYFLVDDRFLVQDSKHVPRQQARIFCPWLWAIDDRDAVIEIAHDRAVIASHARPGIPVVGHPNYYHWLIETAGNCAAWEGDHALSTARILTYIGLKPFQRDIMNTVLGGREWESALPGDSAQYRIEDAFISTPLARDQFAHPKVTAFLRDKFRVSEEAPRRPTKLFLTRGSSSRGSMVNEHHARELLERYGFTMVDTATLTVAEQRELFARCEMIAAPGGAALANLVFCPATAKVLIFGPETGTFETFMSLAATVGGRSWLCVGRTIDMKPHALYLWTQHRFAVDLGDLKICLDEMHAG